MDKKDILPQGTVLSSSLSYEEYLSYIRDSLFYVFGIIQGDPKSFSFDQFLQNTDHGAIHTYNVYKKASIIADFYQAKTGQQIDRSLLYIMSVMHDSGRFRYSLPNLSDTPTQVSAKEKKRNKAEKDHARYGLAQINLAKQKLQEVGIEVSVQDYEKIRDYILNHDFFTTRLDGDGYTEPSSIEGQIVRLADRISVPVTQEIDRYWATGKRLGTPYFIEEIDLKDRLDFAFPKIGSYIKAGKFDEFTFFLSLLSQSEHDFQDPILASMYQDWATSKRAGVERILSIAKEEGYTEEQLKKMEILIKEYFEHFDVSF